MKIKNIIFFVLAVGISLLGSTWRWGDSAHSIGLVKASGGEARHPSFLESGKDGYTLIATATVIPPYRGDARVALEGEPKMEYKLYASGPIINLGVRHWPVFKDDTFYNLNPRDRIALWVVMKPPVIDPVCGMAYQSGFSKYAYKGKDYFFCSEGCMNSFRTAPEKYKDLDSVRGKYNLVFYDTKTEKSVLRVPVIFKGKGDMKDAGEHHH